MIFIIPIIKIQLNFTLLENFVFWLRFEKVKEKYLNMWCRLDEQLNSYILHIQGCKVILAPLFKLLHLKIQFSSFCITSYPSTKLCAITLTFGTLYSFFRHIGTTYISKYRAQLFFLIFHNTMHIYMRAIN